MLLSTHCGGSTPGAAFKLRRGLAEEVFGSLCAVRFNPQSCILCTSRSHRSFSPSSSLIWRVFVLFRTSDSEHFIYERIWRTQRISAYCKCLYFLSYTIKQLDTFLRSCVADANVKIFHSLIIYPFYYLVSKTGQSRMYHRQGIAWIKIILWETSEKCWILAQF